MHTANMGCTLLFLAAVAAVVVVDASSSAAELQRLRHLGSGDDGSLSVLVVGDWGRHGFFNQSLVAAQMGRTAEELKIDFVISTGDNFYDNGLTGIEDEAFRESFANIYTAQSLQKQWYSVLGNHDYRGDVLAQLSTELTQIDSRWLCMRSFIVDAGIAQFFFVDTTPMVLKYWSDPEGQHYDWRGVEPREDYIANLLQGLDSALRSSTAKWKFVVGHHTLRTVSEHGDTEELVELLLPILKANNVDLYINGHDHCLEHISSNNSQIQFLTSGGGSKAWRGTYSPTSEKLRFFYDGQGFMSLQVSKAKVKIRFYDIHGYVLHRWFLEKGRRPWRP